ncbi:ATP synthase subunit a [Lignipirellula cremea]|uniref:ATP synthase subunit a n=2 Tax=Lignipirellula cremea TaxID=2528010 RepID=A0A518E364_9BACT|nr:ATP synthase subunit a [Lignipirellula cremea]
MFSKGTGHIQIPQLRDWENEAPLFTPTIGFAPIDQQIEPLDLKVTKFMLLEVIGALVISCAFIWLAQRMRKGGPPRGRLWNMLESILLFLRDEVVRPSIASHDDHGHEEHAHDHPHMHHEDDVAAFDREAILQTDVDAPASYQEHEADKYLPFLWTLFFFVLVCNLMGMFPWLGSPTGAFGVTGTLALITFITVIVAGVMKLGPVGYLGAQVPTMELPLVLAVFLKPMIFVIEIGGLLIKHFVLGVRLLANMFAGHLVLAVLVSFIAVAAPYTFIWGVAPASVLGAFALSLLELFVAFLQAYIFTFLAALFIGMAVHPH